MSETDVIRDNGYRFSLDVVRYALWIYFRFGLSLRDVEELLSQRGAM